MFMIGIKVKIGEVSKAHGVRGQMKIKSIKKIDKLDRYDLTVNTTHNFFANNVLIHNTSEKVVSMDIFSISGKPASPGAWARTGCRARRAPAIGSRRAR